MPITAHLGAGGLSEIWYSPADTLTATITFDLGRSFTIDGFALWADWQGVGQTVGQFTLAASDSATFAASTPLGSFVASDGPGSGNAASNFGQVFRFAPTAASFVQMDILGNTGSTLVVGFGEAAFRIADGTSPPSTVIPVPAALPLLAAGIAMLGAAARATRRN